jgi:hypothetical protein
MSAAHQHDMTQPAATAPASKQVPLHHLSTALDEIYLLRSAVAYESDVNRATAEMNVPLGLSAVLDEVSNTLLIPAATGKAYTIVGKNRVGFTRSGWEALRGLRRRPEQWAADEYLVDEAAYLTALEEVRALRTIMARAAKRMPDVLLFKTLPASRRPIVERQIDRMKTASTDPTRAYATTSSRVMKYALVEVAGSGLLNASSFAAEVADRP